MRLYFWLCIFSHLTEMQNIADGPKRKIARGDFLASTPAGAIKNLVSQDPLHLVKALGMSSDEVIALLKGPVPTYFVISTSMLFLGGKITLIRTFFDTEEMDEWMSDCLVTFGTSQEELILMTLWNFSKKDIKYTVLDFLS